jgi:hypothetical protein
MIAIFSTVFGVGEEGFLELIDHGGTEVTEEEKKERK